MRELRLKSVYFCILAYCLLCILLDVHVFYFVDANTKSVIRTAMQLIETRTCIKFRSIEYALSKRLGTGHAVVFALDGDRYCT